MGYTAAVTPPTPPIGSEPPDVKIERVAVSTGARGRFGNEVVTHFSGPLWADIRLNEGWRGSTEHPEGYLTRHYLAVLIEDPIALDLWWPGKRYTAHRIAPGRLTILPAHVPWASRAPAGRSLNIDIAPD